MLCITYQPSGQMMTPSTSHSDNRLSGIRQATLPLLTQIPPARNWTNGTSRKPSILVVTSANVRPSCSAPCALGHLTTANIL